MSPAAGITIIGGGIAGCSIAYHLARRGADVLLLEKAALTSGSTWHAAGLVTQFHTSPALMRMRRDSIAFYRELQAQAGHHIGWNQVGSLRVAASQDQFRFLQRQVGTAKAIGLEVEIIGAADAVDVFPYMSSDHLFGAIYLPGDGHLDPHRITTEIARRARELGASIRTDTLVTGIEVDSRRRVVAVLTDRERIPTEVVVNAAGMWGRQVGEMAGVDLPITPLVHQHATARSPHLTLPAKTPCLRDPENLFYAREEQGGLLVGGFERDPVTWSVEGVPWDFAGRLLAPDWELFRPIMEGAARRIPALAEAELVHLVNGPEGVTPDSRPLLGPVPGVSGLWVACGLSHTGFGAGAAIGEVLADWMIEGQPPYDVSEMNVRRFGPIYRDRFYAAERARESYRYYYTLRYPHDENEWGRDKRRSPLHARLADLGAVFGEKNGWERVNYCLPDSPARRAGAEQGRWGWDSPPFADLVEAEHAAARGAVAIWDMSSFGKIDVVGPEALPLLQRLADNQLDRPVGTIVYTQFLNAGGGIESDLTVTRLGSDHFRVVTGSNFVASDLGWIVMHNDADGSVRIEDVTEEWATIGLWGPQSRRVLGAVSQSDLSFPYMTERQIEVNGVPVLAHRVTYVGELGWELYVAPDHAGRVWDALMGAGRPFHIRPAGYKALDSLRLEKGYRYWSADLTPSDNPFDAGLGFCVKFDKGEFIGREALLQASSQRGIRRLCTVKVEGGTLYGGEPVLRHGEIVGRLRSAGFGFTVGSNIGLVYLPNALSSWGTSLTVEAFGQPYPAEVTRDALYDPAGARVRA